MRAWARRTTELHGELAAIADLDPRWWLLAGGAAAAETVPSRSTYVASNAEPEADTFIGIRAREPVDWVARHSGQFRSPHRDHTIDTNLAYAVVEHCLTPAVDRFIQLYLASGDVKADLVKRDRRHE